MKKTVITALLSFLSLFLFSQENEITFDIQDFSRKTDITDWLYEYDVIAWWTTDSVMTQDSSELARLGKEWFCFKGEDKNWHAVYGKFSQGNFDQVFHFIVDSNQVVQLTKDKVDTAITHSYSRALQTSLAHIKPHTDSVNLRFNQYIKQNDDLTFSVYILAAFQPNGWAVYGKEFILQLDKNGKKVIKDNSYYNTDFRGFKVGEPREVWIDQSHLEKPTLGVVFFVWYYKRYFTYINIENTRYITRTLKLEDNGYTWIHIEKKPKTED